MGLKRKLPIVKKPSVNNQETKLFYGDLSVLEDWARSLISIHEKL